MKIALIVVGCLLALMAVLLCLRAGVLAEYSEDGVLVQVRMAFLRFTVVPAPKKSGNKKRKEPKKKAEPGKKAAVRKVLPKKGGLPLRATLALVHGPGNLGGPVSAAPD